MRPDLMAVEDTWTLKDGKTPSLRHGRGLRYRVRWPGVRARSFRTKGEADRWWLKIRTDLAKPAVERVYVGDLVERWLATKKGLSPRGYRACLDASRHVREQWADDVANDVTRLQVATWLAEMPYGRSLKHKVLQCLSGAFRTFPLVENPCAGLKVGQEQRREARFLSLEELWSLADAAAPYRPMVLFLGTTGLRIGECVALDVGDVDAARGRARSAGRRTGRLATCRCRRRCWLCWTWTVTGASRSSCRSAGVGCWWTTGGRGCSRRLRHRAGSR